MGIKAGSGKGSVDAGGSKKEVPGGVGSSNRRKRPSFPPPPPKKPLQPTTDNPFPEKKDFRLGQYRVLEERDDYLLCTGFDPNAKNPFSEVTPSAFRTGSLMKVAKPPALQRTGWGSETQLIEHPYEVGDVIVAVQIRKSAAVDGMEVTDEEGARLRWIDLNVSGRHCAENRYAELTSALAAATNFKTGAATASAKFLDPDPDNPGQLIDGSAFTVVSRWQDLELDSGKKLVVARMAGEWGIIASECP
jgi:hypothetical protein